MRTIILQQGHSKMAFAHVEGFAPSCFQVQPTISREEFQFQTSSNHGPCLIYNILVGFLVKELGSLQAFKGLMVAIVLNVFHAINANYC